MEKQIKAIDTFYKGHKFRSRNEARWAIYFDVIGVKWEYEPEGFVLSDGSTYLPDFWFPNHESYGEVKPTGFEEDPRHKKFVMESKSNLLLFIGPPGDAPNELFWYDVVPCGPQLEIGEVVCHADGRAFTKEIMGKDFGLMYFGDVFSKDFAILDVAIRKATQARFEHGEKPEVKRYCGFYK